LDRGIGWLEFEGVQKMFRLSPTYDFVRRPLMLAALLGAGVAMMGAQVSADGRDASGDAAAATTTNETQPKLNLSVPDALGEQAPVMFSSSSADNEVALNAAHFNFVDAQYGGGHRYGKPRYRGGNTNADGSPKYDFFIGGGFGVPIGSDSDYLTTSWGFGGGGGRMFSEKLGVNVEFNYDYFGMTGQTIANQQALYNYYIALYNLTNPGNPIAPIAGLDANSHIWSFSLNPIYNLKSGEGFGAYITGGGGFYHKVANFEVPAVGTYCDPYYGCYQYVANQIIDHYTSNAFGIDGAFGVTYKFSKFANEKLYAEVRYVYIFNSYRPGVTLDTATPGNAYVANDFPANSNRTSYLPVKFGLRF
jgi:hypothetical protein